MVKPNAEDIGQWDQLWRGCHLATFVDKDGDTLGIIEDGAIATKTDKITWIGRDQDLPSNLPVNLKVHCLDKQWLLPGFIDCHTHLVYGGNRADEFAARQRGESYESIAKKGGGIQSTVNATRNASEQTLLQGAIKRVQALQCDGVTHIEVKSGYGLDLANERKQLEVAKALETHCSVGITKTFLGAHTLPKEHQSDPEGYIDQICNIIMPTLHREGLIDQVDGFCENVGFNANQIEKVFQAANSLAIPIKLHAEQLSHSGGTRLACQYHALSADHLEYIHEADVKLMKDAGLVAVLLPTAFYFLRETQAPPIDLLRQYNVPIAIATDSNPGSSPCTSLLLAANMGCTLFNLNAEEALKGMSRNAALALGLSNQIGTLEIGKKADFAIWNVSHPNELVYHIHANHQPKLVKSGVIVLT